jgi:HK97 family phage portal protein
VVQQIFGTGRHAAGTYSPAQAYALSPYVAPSVHAFASVVAARTFQVKRGTKPLDTHPLLDLIARPNADLRTSEYELLYYSAALHRHAGEVFWECEYGNDPKKPGKARHPKALPTKIWIWHREVVNPEFDSRTREFLGWTTRLDGIPHFVDRLDMLHFPVYDPTQHNPKGPARGTSVWQSKRLSLANEIDASKWNRDFFSRGIAPSVAFINKDGQAISDDPEAEEQFREKLKAKLAGKNGEPIALTGDWVIQQLEASQRDAQFTEGQNLNRKAILAGVAPPIVLGDNEANYANANAQIKAWLTFDVIPAMTMFCSRIDSAFFYDEPELWSNLSTDDIAELQADKLALITAYCTLIGTRHSPKAAAEMVGLSVDPDMPGYNDVTTSFSQIPWEFAAGGQSVSISKADEDPALIEATTPADVPAPVVEPASPEPTRTIRILLNEESRIAPMTRADEDESEQLQLLLEIITKDTAKLKNKAKQFQLQVAKAGVEQIGNALDLETLVAIDDPRIVKLLEERGNLITSVPETVANSINDMILADVEEGLSPEEIGRHLRDSFNELSGWKSQQIARQEVGSVLNGSRFVQMEESGVESREWLSARDGNERPTHGPPPEGVDGEVVEMDEKYSNGLRYPQDPDGDNSEVQGCRCAELPVFGGSRGARCKAHMRALATHEIRAAALEAERQIAAVLRGRKIEQLAPAEFQRVKQLRVAAVIDEREGMWRAVVRPKNVRIIERQMSNAMSSIIHGWRSEVLKALAEKGIAK